MRAVWPIFVASALLGCKDSQPAKPADQPPAPAAPSGAGSAATATPRARASALSVPAMPRLDETTSNAAFEAEVEDKDWAGKTERAIKAAAPELADIDCKQRQCRATLTAASEADLVAKADRLSDGEALGRTDAKRILLTGPVDANGKLSMKIYVMYDR
jgi:hypothetical protein